MTEMMTAMLQQIRLSFAPNPLVSAFSVAAKCAVQAIEPELIVAFEAVNMHA